MENQYEQLELLSISKAAVYLHVSRETVRNLIKNGKIKVIKIEARFKIPIKSLIEFLDLNHGIAEDQPIIQHSSVVALKENLHSKKNSSDRISHYLDQIMGEN